MNAPPTFTSVQDYFRRLADVDFWRPYLSDILERHSLTETDCDTVAGVGGTYPTFLYGDVVLKLFGHIGQWQQSYRAERAAYEALLVDSRIAAPNLLALGCLFGNGGPAWPYLITTRMPGVSWRKAVLSNKQKLSVAAELGRQIGRLHGLNPSDVAAHEDWLVMDVVAAAKKSSLPPRLIGQIDDYLVRLGPFDRVFVHSDLMVRHVFVEEGRLSGVIDWGDAMITDRHYELAKLHLDLFECEKSLLRKFLEASDWPMAEDFPQKAMGMALYRQAHGLVQHPSSMDVFSSLPDRLPLKDFATLDELADELFAV